MPFDPNVPQNGQNFDADIVRVQLNALNDKIDSQAGIIAGQSALITAQVAAIAALTLSRRHARTT